MLKIKMNMDISLFSLSSHSSTATEAAREAATNEKNHGTDRETEDRRTDRRERGGTRERRAGAAAQQQRQSYCKKFVLETRTTHHNTPPPDTPKQPSKAKKQSGWAVRPKTHHHFHERNCARAPHSQLRHVACHVQRPHFGGDQVSKRDSKKHLGRSESGFQGRVYVGGTAHS